jgi:hypothetical protein
MKTKNGRDLKEVLEELYNYYFSEVKRLIDNDETDSKSKGERFSGGLDAVSAIYLALYGAQELTDLWNSAKEKSEGATNDETTGG